VILRNRAVRTVRQIQNDVINEMKILDPDAEFIEDRWERQNGGGGGITCVVNNGKVFEKAGVNVSVVHGTLTPRALQAMSSDHAKLAPFVEQSKTTGKGIPFWVTGVSLIIHPLNPFVPTVHMNVRYCK
jgi:coproporphyrinogen III oxidase